MKQILIAIGLILGLMVTCWGGFTYLEKYALCEDVKKVDQKTDKIMEMLDQKTDKMQKIMDYKFSAYELKTVEERIYEKEKQVEASPRDSVKRADLEKLKREREQILRDMEDIKKR